MKEDRGSMRIHPTVAILSMAIASATVTLAQEATPPPTPPPPTNAPPPMTTPPVSADRRDAFPSVNVYLPEGQASIRLRKLIQNVLFESQIDYKFVNGDISLQKFSLAAAVTESARISTGDYKYTKLEAEVLRRFDITSTSFFVTRAHAGTFLTKSKVEGADTLPPIAQYTIPAYELFNL